MPEIKLIRNISQPSNVLQELNRQRKKNVLCEVTIVTGSNKLHAHQCVLAACSGYFRKLFTVDKPSLDEEIEVSLRRATYRGLKGVLDYCYGEDICVSEDSINEILQTSLFLNINDLSNDLQKYMISILNPSNCLRMLSMAKCYHLTRFSKVVIKFICENFEAVYHQEAFYFLPFKLFEKILKSEHLMIECETTLYEVLLTWVKFEPNSRENLFPRLFPYIRLEQIPKDFLLQVVRHEELVNDSPICKNAVHDCMHFHLKPDDFPNTKAPRMAKQPDQMKCFFFSKSSLHLYSDGTMEQLPACEDCKEVTNQSVVVHRSEVYYIGGKADNMATSMARMFDGEKWNRLPSMLVDRIGAAAVYYQGKLFVFGGSTSANTKFGSYTNIVECLDLQTKEWFSPGVSPSTRCGSSAVVMEEMIYILGGNQSFEGLEGMVQGCSLVEIYDPRSNSWFNSPNMINKRVDFTSQSLQQQIFVFGGDIFGQNTVEVYNLFDDVWSLVKDVCPVPLAPISTAIYGNTVYLTSRIDVSSVWKADMTYGGEIRWEVDFKEKEPEEPATKTEQTQTTESDLDELPTNQCNDEFLVLGSSMYSFKEKSSVTIKHSVTGWLCRQLPHAQSGSTIVFFGGMIHESKKVSQYSDGLWSDLPPMSVARENVKPVFVGDDLYVYGGSANDSPLNVIEKFDKSEKVWKKLNQMPDGTNVLTAVAIENLVYILYEMVRTNLDIFSLKKQLNVRIHNTKKDTWTDGPKMPETKGMIHAKVYKNTILVIDSGAIYSLNVDDQSWIRITTIPWSREVNNFTCCLRQSKLYLRSLGAGDELLIGELSQSMDKFQWKKGKIFQTIDTEKNMP